VNVRYDDDVVSALEAAGHVAIEFDAESPSDPIAAAVEGRDDLTETFVLYQTGGYGIEPITYVLGPDAQTVARVVRDSLLD
jgi:predicted fused transcriptional regulator/phosphomethylpyrimidine kinase